jgi:anaerobic ribonucleoside-triphosphate reductase activating protein
MRYGQIRKYDVANGPGIRTSFFVTGCDAHCKNCFNTEYMSFSHGDLWTEKETWQIIENLNRPEISGLTILGGEPFENLIDLLAVVKEIRANSDKSIWIFSGFKFEMLSSIPLARELLSYCDVLVDGLFVEELKDLRLKFRGSSNQRIIDIKKSLEENQAIWVEEYR